MNYIVLDLEWNQSSVPSKTVDKMPFEIIEIGAVKLDESLNEVGRFRRIIRPRVYKELHFMTKQIISISEKELSDGVYFERAMDDFLDWCRNGSDSYMFVTWGNMDLIELQRNIRYFKTEELSNEPLKYYDLQKLFKLCYETQNQVRTLQYAASFLGINEKLKFHSALNDAIYTAKVMQKMDFDGISGYYSIDCYHLPTSVDEELNIDFPTYSKYISRGFDDREEILSDRKSTTIYCNICHKRSRKIIKWFAVNSKTYYGVAECRNHGYIRSKLRIRQNDDGKFYVYKTSKMVNQDKVDEIEAKRLAIKAKRKKKSAIPAKIKGIKAQ